jgi:2,4-dienoyl-CoA reductase-like NADH-dependent reductase (Old Yellow Enzyme family)
MVGIHSDELVPDLAALAGVVHRENGRVAVQINYRGAQRWAGRKSEPADSSAGPAIPPHHGAREMTPDEIELVIEAFGQAARRAQQAGFDGVQIHGAHGYLVNQFLSPLINQRGDEWGGSLEGRMRFLRAVCREIRQQVGPDYPVLIKLAMMDHAEGGLTAEDGVQVVAALEGMGLDAVEISGGIGGTLKWDANMRPRILSESDEAYFRELAVKARPATSLPIALVGGFRSRSVMDAVLNAGDADFISLSRPLICEPDLPNKLRAGLQERSSCISAGRCWPAKSGEVGIACRCPIVRASVGS